MTTDFPKRQHYIPKMLLKHFCDDNGQLWVGNKDWDDVIRLSPQNAFVRSHLYTRYAYDHSPPSDEYEQILSRVEDDAAPVVDKVVSFSRRVECPDLSSAEQAALQRFVLALARRTPESQKRVSRELTDDHMYDIVRKRAEKVGFTELPAKPDFFNNSEWRQFVDRITHNADAVFAAGTDSNMVEENRKFIAETGIRFAVINGSDKSFAIGSHGLTLCDALSVSSHLAGTVLPIAYDVLAHVTPWPCKPNLLVIGDDPTSSDLIDAVNMTTAEQSRTIAGRSEALIRPLLR